MPQPESSAEFYRTLQRLQVVILGAGRRAWSRMGSDFDASWARELPALLTVTSAGQFAAARAATEYVPAVLAETGQPDAPDARVRPQAFAGVAADGRSLPGLLQGAVVRAKTVAAPSQSAALQSGGAWLDAILQTAVTDAARLATQAEVATRDGMGWVRAINPPCCSRCAILAGRWYRFDAGFARHPRCDCFGIPAQENVAGSLMTSPQALFDSDSVHGLTKRERDRLAAGDDIYKVVNESRDMWRARISEQKAAAKQGGGTVAERDARARQGLEDLFASTRTRVDALNAMKAQGFTN